MVKKLLILLVCVASGLSCMYGKKKVKKGRASYYSSALEGRRTSNGDIYSGNALTCAHRTLPFGTLLKVRNPKNNREVIVRVNDRGPFVRGRMIDLSYAAAKQLGFVSNGIAMVEVSRYNKADIPLRDAGSVNWIANVKIPLPKPKQPVPHYRIMKSQMAKLKSPLSGRGTM